MRALSSVVVVPFVLITAGIGRAGDSRTSLIIEGGGLPLHCPALERLVEAATVNGRIRIGFIPTASGRPDVSTRHFVERLKPYGVRPEDIQAIDITVKNADKQADDPVIVAQIRECTAIFFGGGDQTRITRALLKPDGSSTTALEAIHAVRQRGGVIAGSSAGAAVQSETMISVSGFPDDTIDDGMDALDFGLTKLIGQPARRGLLVSRGLGFLSSGIIDQHFSQYRGRLGRLARAAIEERVRYGFGIDEDAALAVATDGTLEVLGPGHVTIVDAAGATCQDGPLGCRISGVHLTCLGHGDRFDPGTDKAIIHPNKQPIARGDERNNGNFQIPDIAGRGAVLHALIEGLGHNTSRQQIGITLKHHRHYGHGYRHTFSKTDQTALYEGLVHGVDVEAVTRVRLDIDPVALTLRPPETGLPSDLPQGPLRIMLEAISFRGIMLADEHSRFRPNDPITRGELASAITRVIRLEPPRNNPAMIIDLPALSPEADEIVLVVAAGLMKTVQGSFRPADSISRQEAAVVLVRLKERYQSVVLSRELATFPDVAAIDPQLRSDVFAAHRENLLATDASGIRPTAKLTRAEVAAAIFSIIDFPWDQPRR